MFNEVENTSTMKETKSDAVVVYSPAIADQLLRLGYTIFRIKPHNKYRNANVFLFKNEEGIIDILNGLVKKSKEEKKANEEV